MNGPGPGFSLPFRVMGALAGAAILFLVIGFLLPGRWTTERAVWIEAPPDRVYEWVGPIQRWDEWTRWGDVDSSLEGPGAGPGARRVWDDEEMGSGRFEVTAASRPDSLAYDVAVDDGAIRFQGRLRMTPEDGGTRVTWREEGNLGWNPLLGYMALAMGRLQGAELEKSLERLKAAVEEAG